MNIAMVIFDGKWLLRAGAGLLLLFVIIALGADFFAPHPLNFRGMPYLSPSWLHPLGTNDIGGDILTTLIYAGRISLIIGISASIVSLLIGTAIGLLAGYSHGIRGEILTGLIDTVLLIPILPLLVVLAAYLGQSVFNIILVIALLGWCSTARAVRAKVFQLRESNFVEAFQALGFSGKRILFCHILPNVSEIISAKFVLSVAGAMLSEAALSFLGFGDPHRPSWGKMIHYAFQRGGFANGLWHWYIPPGICITLCTLGFILIGMYWEQREMNVKRSEWLF